MCFAFSIIIAFGPYWSIGCLQELSRHPDPGPASQGVPRYNPSSLSQPPDHRARCFFGSLAFSFPVGSRSGFDVWYRSLAFGGCVQSISSRFRGFYPLLVVAWLLLKRTKQQQASISFLSQSFSGTYNLRNCFQINWTLECDCWKMSSLSAVSTFYSLCPCMY